MTQKLEACGHYVRTTRNPDGSGGLLVAECSLLQPNAQELAELFAKATGLRAALMRIADRSLGWSAEDFRRCARAALNGAGS